MASDHGESKAEREQRYLVGAIQLGGCAGLLTRNSTNLREETEVILSGVLQT
jgi:hypothetical protein